MSVFGFSKKKEESTPSCCCDCAQERKDKEVGVKILGGGCAKCNALEAATENALRELGLDTTIDHIRDFEKINGEIAVPDETEKK